MTDLQAARSQMAVSLGFHIVFSAIGIAMPFLMAFSHWKWLRTRDLTFFHLTKTWSKGVAIFFATGAVSGTVLSFELGLLWPKFMLEAGPVIGMPFSWEGSAFFLEAIAIGLFLYGWKKMSPWTHWFSGVAVGVTGVLSGFFVICANGWMNSPRGFDWVKDANGVSHAINIDPWRAMFNPSAWLEGLHMTIAAFCAVGFAAAGLHAFGLLRHPKSRFHLEALKIALVIGACAALLQPLQGDRLAKQVAVLQPEKLAAMEGLFHSEKPASLVIGGFPVESEERVEYGLHVPYALSFLAHGDFDSEVEGLDRFPRDTWPPVAPTHLAFELMVAIGTLLALVGAISLGLMWRKPEWLVSRRFLSLLVAMTPLGFLALEAGWVVTEVGRQPWIIYGLMRTSEAVTPMPGLIYPFAIYTCVYVGLSFVVTWLMTRLFRHVE